MRRVRFELRAEQETAFAGGVIAGLDVLGQSRAATSPRVWAALRDALGQFISAAHELGGASLRAKDGGVRQPRPRREGGRPGI